MTMTSRPLSNGPIESGSSSSRSTKPPYLEPSRREAIEDYIARRKSEGGVKAA